MLHRTGLRKFISFIIIGFFVLYGLISYLNARGSTTTTRVSVSSVGVQSNGQSVNADISADGIFAVFHSSATNLVVGDTNASNDIFLHDTQTGTTTRVSVATGGGEVNGASNNPSISGDGRYIVFQSAATNLVAGDTNGAVDIFLHDTQTGTTTRVSVATGGGEGNAASNFAVIADDGRYVIFTSSATNLVVGDTNAFDDTFLHDTQTGTTTRVSVATGGAQATGGHSSASGISADGRYIAFNSSATNLIVGDTNAVPDIFLHDTQTGTTTRVSVATGGGEANGAGSFGARISADGRYVAFDSYSSNLVVGDTNAVRDTFLHDTQTGTTTRVSVATGGGEGNNVSIIDSISSDGRYVLFESFATNLVVGDINGQLDVFLHDTQTGTTTRVSVATGGGEGDGTSFRSAISSDGTKIIFLSNATNLIVGDTNATYDAFLVDISVSSSSSSGFDFVPPPTCSISASPQTITGNQSTILSWSVTPTSSSYFYRLNEGEIISSTTTTQIITPTHTTTYQLSVINLFGANFCETTVEVVDPQTTEETTPPADEIPPVQDWQAPQPLTCTVEASPSTLTQNQSTQLTWNIAGGISPYLTYLNPNGSPISQPYTTTPSNSETLTIYVKDDADTVASCSTHVDISLIIPPPLESVVPPEPPLTGQVPTPTQGWQDLSNISLIPIDIPTPPFLNLPDVEPGIIEFHPTYSPLDTYLSISNFFRTEPNSLITKIITTTLLALGVITALGSSLFASPLSFSELIFIPLRLWSILLTAFGYKKETRPWGIIYDSVTKAPLDPVYVTLTDLEGKEIANSITDMDGRYGFLVPPGKYRIKAGKGDYTFPSAILAGTSNDALYHDLYFGDVITIYFQGDVIQKNIPLDPTGINWNEQTKQVNNLTHFYQKHDYTNAHLSNILFIIGGIIATLALFFAPQPYNLAIFALYVIFIILKIIKLKPRQYGTITTSNGTPFNGIIHIFSATRNMEVMKKPVIGGKFYGLIPNGEYYYVVDERVNTNEWKEVWRSGNEKITNGIISKHIKIV